LYEWIVDNQATPYIIVSTILDGVSVPLGRAENGRIVLNIGPNSIRNLNITNDGIDFDGRFSGQPFHVHAPIGAVMAVYAKETGEGMAFELDQGTAAAGEEPTASQNQSRPGSHLHVVK
jgi:stringent starvation protein B